MNELQPGSSQPLEGAPQVPGGAEDLTTPPNDGEHRQLARIALGMDGPVQEDPLEFPTVFDVDGGNGVESTAPPTLAKREILDKPMAPQDSERVGDSTQEV